MVLVCTYLLTPWFCDEKKNSQCITDKTIGAKTFIVFQVITIGSKLLLVFQVKKWCKISHGIPGQNNWYNLSYSISDPESNYTFSSVKLFFFYNLTI